MGRSAKLVLDFFLHPAMTNSLVDLRFLMSNHLPSLSSHLKARCNVVYKSAVLRWTVFSTYLLMSIKIKSCLLTKIWTFLNSKLYNFKN